MGPTREIKNPNRFPSQSYPPLCFFPLHRTSFLFLFALFQPTMAAASAVVQLGLATIAAVTVSMTDCCCRVKSSTARIVAVAAPGTASPGGRWRVDSNRRMLQGRSEGVGDFRAMSKTSRPSIGSGVELGLPSKVDGRSRATQRRRRRRALKPASTTESKEKRELAL